ncbi:MAG: hypothetical protein M3Q98_13910 [Actinomycetota bacterium]|nr:hypothetical protein [Actinomycetota bacterium]
MTDSVGTGAATPRANLTLGLGLAALATQVIAMVANGDGDKYGWIWVIMAALGVAAVAVGWTARQAGHFPMRALIGMVIGALLVLLFLLFLTGVLS